MVQWAYSHLRLWLGEVIHSCSFIIFIYFLASWEILGFFFFPTTSRGFKVFLCSKWWILNYFFVFQRVLIKIILYCALMIAIAFLLPLCTALIYISALRALWSWTVIACVCSEMSCFSISFKKKALVDWQILLIFCALLMRNLMFAFCRSTAVFNL